MTEHRVPKVRVVVLNYNGGELVAEAFEALTKTDWPADQLELVMIDNASTDDSRNSVAERFADVTIIDAPTNGGFPANNLGLSDLGDCEYVALINNDAFVSPNWLAPLVETMEQEPQIGAACPKILLARTYQDFEIDTRTDSGVKVTELNVDGTTVLAGTTGSGITPATVEPHRTTNPTGTLSVPMGRRVDSEPWTMTLTVSVPHGEPEPTLTFKGQPIPADRKEDSISYSVTSDGLGYRMVNNAGSVLLKTGYGADRGLLQPDGNSFDQPCDVIIWCGAAVLLRREYLAEVGLFDESFFMYYEDTDLSLRGQHAGWDYRYDPRSVVEHMHGSTSVIGSSMFVRFNERNRLAMLTKNAPLSLLLVGIFRGVATVLIVDLFRPILRRQPPDIRSARGRLSGMLGWLGMLPSLLRKRRRILKRSVIGTQGLIGRLEETPLVE